MSDKILAFVSSMCPFCVAKRRWPFSFYGRVMGRLETFCPFCRAYGRLHPPPPGKNGAVKNNLV